MSDTINSKLMPLDEAVRTFIKPGTHLSLGGFTALRRPMAFAREIARQNIGDLFLSSNGMGIAEEILIGCGLVSRLETTLLGGVRPMHVGKAGTVSIENGQISVVEDYSNWSFALRTIAGHYGLPFIPCMSIMGSDIEKYDSFGKAGLRGFDENGAPLHPGIPPKKHVVIDDPFEGYGLRPVRNDTTGNQTNNYLKEGIKNTAYTGKPGVKVGLVPPLITDVCVVHAQSVSTDGIVRIDGLLAEDADQSFCGKHLIVECERICSSDELRQEPEHNHIPPHMVDAIVVSPFGGYPGNVPGYYDSDKDFTTRYKAAVGDKGPDEIKAWWKEELNCGDEWNYLMKHVGWEKLQAIRANPRYRY